MKRILFFTIALVLSASAGGQNLKVAALHPLMGDLARQVGGERVEVIDLLQPGGDPHAFEPSPRDLARAADARLILASGKGMETYLHKLKSSLGPGQEIYEVGRKVPSLKVEVGGVFVCCPKHSVGSLDPHWWHSVANMNRAARYLGDEFARVDPANKAAYRAGAAAYRKRLDALDKWARTELRKVPRGSRYLATAHAAFGYFCRDFGFQSIPVQGLGREEDPSPKYLVETITALRKARVKAVFPETLSNPKVLASIAKETGVRTGGTLVADGTASGAKATYEGMIRHNISTIVAALAGG